jgi:hypothetical protein
MAIMPGNNTNDPDDIVRGCVKYLLGISDITNAVGSDSDGPWIFEGTCGVRMQGQSINTPGSAVTSIVVYRSGNWGTPAPGMTAEFPKLGFEIWADPPRQLSPDTGKGEVTRPQDARVAAEYLYSILDYYMNRTYRGIVMFGDVYTFDSVRLGSMTYLPTLPSDDHTIMGSCFYGLQSANFFTPS